MGKRFTDSELWDKPWFMALTPSEKCAWMFIKDKCDAVGVWVVNYKLANVYIGEEIDWIAFKEKCNGNIVDLGNGKWWLIDFCDFQYGKLEEVSSCKPVMSYIKLLKAHGLWETYQQRDTLSIGYGKGMDTLSIGYGKGIDTLKEKEKEKEKEQEKVKEKEQEKEKEKGKEVLPVVVEDNSLYNKIKHAFELIHGPFANYGKEGTSIKRIIKLTQGDEQAIGLMLKKYHDLTKSNDKFWSKQPYTPSALLSLWERVKVEAQQEIKTEDVTWIEEVL